MERITSPARIISILIYEGLTSSYSHLFKPASLVKRDKELMRYTAPLYDPNCFRPNTDVVVNSAFTFSALLLEAEDEKMFYPNNYWFRSTKRAFDIVFSLGVIILILSWLLPIIALLITIESKGPAIFSQRRSSRNNKTFYCYKFRSMYMNDECDTSQTAKNDARITKIGAFLRRHNLDELPQFFNVLKGDMSVIGPRPHMLSQTKEYAKLIDSFMIRHFVKPGITGWAQVNGLRGQTTSVSQMQKRVEADIWYLKNWSFLLDLKITARTMLNVITGNKDLY